MSPSLLVLGGTGFVGRHITEAAIAAGNHVAVFNRGKTNHGLFPEVERLVGDRYSGDVDALRSGEWDGVIDVNGYHPDHLTAVLDALGDRVGHYTFVSTVSVYAPTATPTDESSTLDTEVHDESEGPHASYGSHKVLCEQAVEAAFGQRSTIIRLTAIRGGRHPAAGCRARPPR